MYSLIIKPIRPFNLEGTLFCGQSFTWIRLPVSNQYFACIIDESALVLHQTDHGLIHVQCTTEHIRGKSIDSFLCRYFSLDIDINTIFNNGFNQKYPDLWALISHYFSVRIMRQDPFEIMVSFMCAQGIGMHLIRRQVFLITQRYGKPVTARHPSGDFVLYQFPTPSVLASAIVDDLARCTNNNRIRAANIIAMAKAFESGQLNFSCVRPDNCSLDSLRETLCKQRGIGMKIADCIALFGLGRFDSFPIDTHVKQYLLEWFGIEAARHSLTEKNYRILQHEAHAILGNDFAGYAGHILFHCWRKEIKKMRAF